MGKEKNKQIYKATEVLDKAQLAVNQGDVLAMLRALGTSGYLDGLTRRLQKKWSGSLPWEEVNECIAQSVDAACAAVRRGHAIRTLDAWLWKSADKIANDRWRFDLSKRVEFNEDTLLAVLNASQGDENEVEKDREKYEAIKIARLLLPKIGEGQVRDVMELVIDAAEDGLPDLPPSSIADELGISSDAARALVSRGLKRLRRLAEQESVEVPTALQEQKRGTEQ